MRTLALVLALTFLAGCHGNVTVGGIDCSHWSEQWHPGPWVENGRCPGCMTRHDYIQGVYACWTRDGTPILHLDDPFSSRQEAPLPSPRF